MSNKQPNDSIWRTSLEISPDRLSNLEAALEALGDDEATPTLSYFEQKHSPLWRVELYHLGAPDPAWLQKLFKDAGLDNRDYQSEALPDTDWVSESQRLLHPIEAARFFVYGAHDADKKQTGKINLQIDAGQAFGTGRHETSFLCLCLIDALEKQSYQPRSILDLGTGSGLLALAAHRLWPESRITASDIDPIAVEVTRENIQINQAKARPLGQIEKTDKGIACLAADGFEHPAFRTEGPFDLVIANILAGPLIDLAADIHAQTRLGGRIILSGLLVTQEKTVLDAYEARGLKLEGRNEKGEWLALQLIKPK